MMLRSLLLISIATGALAGCGLKGPLYLPDQKAQTQDREQQKKERARDTGMQPPPAPSNTGTPPPPTLPREN